MPPHIVNRQIAESVLDSVPRLQISKKTPVFQAVFLPSNGVPVGRRLSLSIRPALSRFTNPDSCGICIAPVRENQVSARFNVCFDGVPQDGANGQSISGMALRLSSSGDILRCWRMEMPRLRTGSILKRKEIRAGKEFIALYARVTFTDPETGKRIERKKRAKNVTHASDLLKKMLREIDDYGERALVSERMTFSELADYYEKHFLIEPVYHDGRKIDGMRSWEKGKRLLKLIRPYFERKPIRSITYNDLARYKTARLKTKTWRGGERSVATVNRELSMLQRIFHVAVQQGWLMRDPFKMGKALISPADEKPRDRVLSQDEEERLLAACTGKRKHLRAILICLVDTGMRRGEAFKLKWQDVEIDRRVIHVRAFNTKTLQYRIVPITTRLADELTILWEASSKNPDASVFGVRDDVNIAFRSACKDAGIDDLRKHDLRHTFATRLIERGLASEFVEKLLGHTQPKTTFRYVNVTADTIEKAAKLLGEPEGEDKVERVN